MIVLVTFCKDIIFSLPLLLRMKAIKNILMFILFATVTCGLVASKSIAYCCGMCHTETQDVSAKDDSCCKSEDSCCHEQTSCCGSEDAEESTDHNCEKTPCHVTVIQFDWSTEIVHKTITPSLPVLDLFYGDYFLTDIVKQKLELEHSQIQSPPLIYPSPREYLSFLNILII